MSSSSPSWPLVAALMAVSALGTWMFVRATELPAPPAPEAAPAPEAEPAPEAPSAPEPADAWAAPDPSTIPDGPLGDAVRRGQTLVTRTFEELPDNVGNDLHCTSCHLQGGTVPRAGPWVGITGVFPTYRSRSASVATLADRINGCFERSMNGAALPVDSPEMTAIVAYMTWLSQGVPTGVSVEGRGFEKITAAPEPDPARGEALYGEKCASCHQADGAGLSGPNGEYVYPALWGERSFNLGAGMARLDTAAAFVRWSMPLGQGGTLTDQDAYDLAAYFTVQPRPDFAGKDGDWPEGGEPRDARY